ncbi:MAG: hypothetical protein NXI20_25570 [bacterium]|nr:hypothetical protein [bacterium]
MNCSLLLLCCLVLLSTTCIWEQKYTNAIFVYQHSQPSSVESNDSISIFYYAIPEFVEELDSIQLNIYCNSNDPSDTLILTTLKETKVFRHEYPKQRIYFSITPENSCEPFYELFIYKGRRIGQSALMKVPEFVEDS